METTNTWKASDEAIGKSKQLRLIAGLLWLVAIAAQIFAIHLLLKQKENVSMLWMIVLILVDLGLVIVGSMLWKQSNRLNPPSEQNKLLFFMQSQLGLFAAIVAFLPLVIFILKDKNLGGKQKAILGSIAGVALLIAGITGYDFNPPSIEKYTEETNVVEALTGENNVYWTSSGGRYHLYEDCSYIKNSESIMNGTVSDSYQTKGIDQLCSRCKSKKMKESELDESTLQDKVKNLSDIGESENSSSVSN